MPLSNVQKGAIGQLTFLATALVTGRGQVEAYSAVADNEGRDAEIRRHLMSMAGISIQVKVAFYLFKYIHRKGRLLSIVFRLAAERVQNDPRLWYFFAYYDQKELRFQNPVFLIPSEVFHRIGRQGTKGRTWFVFNANMAADSRDKWTPYRVAPKDLGKRLLEIVDSAALTAATKPGALPSDGVWLARKQRTEKGRLRRAA